MIELTETIGAEQKVIPPKKPILTDKDGKPVQKEGKKKEGEKAEESEPENCE